MSHKVGNLPARHSEEQKGKKKKPFLRHDLFFSYQAWLLEVSIFYTRVYIDAIQGLIKVNNTQKCESYELGLEGCFFYLKFEWYFECGLISILLTCLYLKFLLVLNLAE